MRAIELTCAAIVGLYVLARLREPGADRRAVLARLLWLAGAGWVGEDSVIRAYGFYGYSSEWSVFLDRVPLLIVAIWPVVIDSAHMLARQLVAPRPSRASRAWRVALAGGLIVLADASLIEPIAVHAHLWTWSPENPRSIFDVPPIGILGWGYFAAAAIGTFEAVEERLGAVAILLAPAATHAALVASWWCGFRWLGQGVGAWAPAVAAWALAVPVAVGAWRRGTPLPLRPVLARAPGAVFFFALLAATASDRTDLVLFAAAFALPYLALIARRARADGAANVTARAEP